MMRRRRLNARSAAMSSRPELRLDWCSHEAAKYACEKWHYSRRLPMPPIVHVGIWENKEFVGCVLFSRGANYQLASPYGLKMMEVAELVRVAMRKHSTPVSRIIAIAMKFLRKNSPGIRLIVSFADPTEGHHGGIYQAGGWLYAGTTAPGRQYWQDGRWKHSREVEYGGFGQGGSKKRDGLTKRTTPGKRRYLMPLDDEMRRRIEPLRKPYPKRVGSADSGTPGIQSGGGGANPTPTLHTRRGDAG